MSINHWVSNLPEFGLTLTIQGLVNERDQCSDQIASLHRRMAEIENEIMDKASRNWSRDEIAQAQASYSSEATSV